MKYVFNLESRDNSRELPGKILIAQRETETLADVLLKLFGYVIFWRPRLQLETDLHDEYIPFVPDLVQLDYELRPALWVECGDCTTQRLDKLAVKAHDAELWVIRKSREDAEHLLHLMARADLRRNRYRVLALDWEMFDEVSRLVEPRNQIVWYRGVFDPPQLQFEFNGLWFEAEFEVRPF